MRGAESSKNAAQPLKDAMRNKLRFIWINLLFMIGVNSSSWEASATNAKAGIPCMPTEYVGASINTDFRMVLCKG